MSDEIVILDNVEKIYHMGKTRVDALRGVNMRIKRGEFVAIMGPSGSGKSTLLHIIGCLDRPTKGMYYFMGMDTSSLSDEELAEIRKSKIGFVFQSFNLLPRRNALYQVELPMIYAGIKREERRRRAVELLCKVGLGERMHHLPSELSGGERQRVAIARALANNPEMIVADEPTGNLDTKMGREIMEIFKKLNNEGKTVVLVTHEDFIARYAERKIFLRDGVVWRRGRYSS